MSILRNIDRYSEKLIIALFMITMTILIFLQVVSRYVFGDSITWTEELSRYLFIWLIFLTIGIGFKENKHIGIDIVLDLLPKTLQKLIRQLTYILVLVLSLLFVWEGYILVLQMQMFGQTSANLQLPMWWVYLSLPVGFLLSTIRLIQASINLWLHKSEEGS
ncbi:TRAP transporter small permease [Bacillus sp. B15-48]|uniref:TRAP transporter small permease n=1 Tax=Bacillus sp. B15-48 TaxID=1548601 RepID=UPI00193F24CE|nr:TRAP transporter small permease [Bacillus sp. B15-48]MBM4761088.1 TRAP transporter small permease subunit [Bacillus sp. B15-48]